MASWPLVCNCGCGECFLGGSLVDMDLHAEGKAKPGTRAAEFATL